MLIDRTTRGAIYHAPSWPDAVRHHNCYCKQCQRGPVRLSLLNEDGYSFQLDFTDFLIDFIYRPIPCNLPYPSNFRASALNRSAIVRYASP